MSPAATIHFPTGKRRARFCGFFLGWLFVGFVLINRDTGKGKK